MDRGQFDARRRERRSLHKVFAVFMLLTLLVGAPVDYFFRGSLVTFWGALAAIGVQCVVFLIYEARDKIQEQIIGQ